MKALWKALPAGVREAAHRGVQAVMSALTPAIVRANWRPGQAGASGDVVLAGFYGSSIGIGRGVRLLAAALEAAGLAVERLDVTEALRLGQDLAAPERASRRMGAQAPGLLVTHFNPPELYHWIQHTWGRGLRGRRHVGYWAWELAELPRGWRRAFGYVDEVWCPSHFTAEAVRAAAPEGFPVRVVAHPMFMTPAVAPARGRFQLPEGVCVVLAALDLKSTSARKNPLGAVEAYRRAVPRPDGKSLLVCKLSGAGAPEEGASEAELNAAMAGRNDIRLMRETLSEADMGALIASADVVLSLHRAEGFGLLAAEGLWLGKPVVATAWSGVMDFLDEDSAVLVPWTKAPVADPQGLYAGGWWAEPDLDAAADRLGALIAEPALRQRIGANARARAQSVFDAHEWSSHVHGLLGVAQS